MGSSAQKLIKQISTGFFVSALYVFAPAQGGSYAFPPDPVEEAKNARVIELIDQAKQLVRVNNDQGAIAKLLEAVTVETTMAEFHARAKYALARMYVKQHRTTEALDAYRATFAWNSSRRYTGSSQAGDLDGASHRSTDAALEYAILLAQQGRGEDAKAMYYFGLRSTMAPRSRSQEPAPFLVVFDPDPEGIYWEYTPQRLEAAACMLQAMLSSEVTDFATNQSTTSRQFVERARALAPDWFYPALFTANQADYDSPGRQQYLAEADARARPGLERQLMERFRRDFADLLVINERNDTPGASDQRPMTDGADRRKRMQCLRPNEQVLRRLSIERPQ
ncbi:MAG: hypothetical protein M3R13_01160 [Armatimonadota bacterium]|nr:hypothetical protein [Armatimonadota bacterium]